MTDLRSLPDAELKRLFDELIDRQSTETIDLTTRHKLERKPLACELERRSGAPGWSARFLNLKPMQHKVNRK